MSGEIVREPSGWTVRTASVEGASHRRTGAPNQDAVGYWRAPDAAACRSLVLALADGHGSVQCFRSAIGARIAVDTAVRLFSELLSGAAGRSAAEVDLQVRTRLMDELPRSWLCGVTEHVDAHAFSAEELLLLRGKFPSVEPGAVLDATQSSLAYGTTLLSVAIGPGFILFLQLGDGEILIVPDAPGTTEAALPEDPQLIANETTSLCMPNARKYFRYRLLEAEESALPRLIVASTDGYPNCFREVADFLQVGSDLRDGIARDGIEPIGDALEGWLREASDEGSGDDATVGIVWRYSDNIAAGAPAAATDAPS